MRLLPAFISSTLLWMSLNSPAQATFDSGSNGSDGAFSPSSSTVIDLSQAGSGPGNGVYDPTRWAVVFNYTTIDIAAGRTITFINHPSGAPVVWLASGDATISGTVRLDGSYGISGSQPSLYSVPGPGGFAGGRHYIDHVLSPATGGFGPGGAPKSTGSGAGGGYGTAGGVAGGVAGGTYGNATILPLIGGSGGGGSNVVLDGGGAGGGAILIASSGNITLNTGGKISALGGSEAAGGGGSGGGIRLVANGVGGSGLLRATGGTTSSGGGAGGYGRIRVEGTLVTLVDPGSPAWTVSYTPGPVFPDSNAPTLAVSRIVGLVAPTDPRAGIETTDLAIADTSTVTVEIAATNIPVGTVVSVVVVPENGSGQTVSSMPLAGTPESSTATAQVAFERGRRSEIFLRADWAGGSATSTPARLQNR